MEGLVSLNLFFVTFDSQRICSVSIDNGPVGMMIILRKDIKYNVNILLVII